MSAQNSQGIQILLEAEKDAAKIVQKGRNYRVQRLKDAKTEAQKEIESLREKKAAEFENYEKSFSGKNDEAADKIDASMEERLVASKKLFEAHKQQVIDKMLKNIAVVTPTLHPNAIRKGEEINVVVGMMNSNNNKLIRIDILPMSLPYEVTDTAPELDDQAFAFLSKWLQCNDIPKLKELVISFWRKSKSKFHVYKCIQEMMFLHPRFPTHHLSNNIIDHLRKGNSKILEIGCCFGTDVRYMILQDVPPSSIVATDIIDGYFNLGKELFQCENEKKMYKVETVFGDFADSNLNFMKEYANDFQFVSCFAALHCLSKNQVENLLRRAIYLLKNGGILFGLTGGSSEPKEWSLKQEMEKVGFHNVDIKFMERPMIPGRHDNDHSDWKLLEFSATK